MTKTCKCRMPCLSPCSHSSGSTLTQARIRAQPRNLPAHAYAWVSFCARTNTHLAVVLFDTLVELGKLDFVETDGKHADGENTVHSIHSWVCAISLYPMHVQAKVPLSAHRRARVPHKMNLAQAHSGAYLRIQHVQSKAPPSKPLQTRSPLDDAVEKHRHPEHKHNVSVDAAERIELPNAAPTLRGLLARGNTCKARRPMSAKVQCPGLMSMLVPSRQACSAHGQPLAHTHRVGSRPSRRRRWLGQEAQELRNRWPGTPQGPPRPMEPAAAQTLWQRARSIWLPREVPADYERRVPRHRKPT